MPLLDHFHAPLKGNRHWHGFHAGWAEYITKVLHDRLPKHYFAEPNVHFGVEIDVAALHDAVPGGEIAAEEWATPPMATALLPLITDVVEVRINYDDGGPVLVGAIELVSPANKDRAEHRDAFVSKCAALLQEGVGLMIVDVVTDRSADLHALLMERIGSPVAEGAPLYATAYRAVRRGDEPHVDIWREDLRVGKALPTMPLWLRGNGCVPVDLDAAYLMTCRNRRLDELLAS